MTPLFILVADIDICSCYIDLCKETPSGDKKEYAKVLFLANILRDIQIFLHY